MQLDGFDWDKGNWPKCGQHGLSKSEIEAIFENAPDVYPDPFPKSKERRLRAIGQNNEGLYVFVAFTIRIKVQQYFIRPISARYMHQKEIAYYERQKTT